ncbi:MAG: lipopolysaccharide biosynthesis protein [Cyclobacteriaceae bacterium]
MSSLKQKTISGLAWSFIDIFSNKGISFVFGIILARLLTPREFGLVGMVSIFIAISKSLMDSGFSSALIRKKDCTQTDYSTVFIFNTLSSIFLYLILYLSANAIGEFFDEPQLELILQVLGIGLIINSFSIIQRAILTKRIDFKLQTKISLLGSLIAGSIGIFLAYSGYGVWSLVYMSLAGFFVSTVLLWLWNQWRPSLIFSTDSFRELFSFGSKLMLSSILNTVYKNIYNLVIAKYYTAADLGFYTRANQFKEFPAEKLTSIIQRVSYPVLSSVLDDIARLRYYYQKLIKSTMLISFVLMMGLAATAEPLIITLIGEKWLPSVMYLQLLCFVGMLYPLHAINLNMLKVLGRSGHYLKLEVIKKFIAIPIILTGIFIGIFEMLLGMIITSFINYFLNSYLSGKLISYSSWKQLKDIFPSFMLALIMGGILLSINMFFEINSFLILMIQVITGIVIIIGVSEIFRLESYIEIKAIVIDKIKRNGSL